MKVFTLKHSICAVSLENARIAKTLPCDSVVTMIGPSEQLHGCVDVECNGKRYAVFPRDLEDWAELSKTTAEGVNALFRD